MNSKEIIRYVTKRGATIHPERGKGGHALAEREGRTTIIPMHGSRKKLGKGLIAKILKDLGLK